MALLQSAQRLEAAIVAWTEDEGWDGPLMDEFTGPSLDELRAAIDTEPKWQENVSRLLANIGDPGQCRGCGADIFWVIHKNGKRVPYTPQALNHFIDCPKAQEFKR